MHSISLHGLLLTVKIGTVSSTMSKASQLCFTYEYHVGYFVASIFYIDLDGLL